MKRILSAEFKRAINIWFALGIFGVAFSICFDSWNDLIRHWENNVGTVHYIFANSAFGGMCREHLLPVFAAFPFAVSFIREKKSKAMPYIVLREGKRTYCTVKYVVNAVSGGVVIALGTALVLLLLIKFPMADSDYLDARIADAFHDWLVVHHPVQYCAVQIFLGFFRGMLWSGAALLVSVYIEDVFVVIVSPYVGSFVFTQLNRLLQIDNAYRLDNILTGRSVIHSSWSTVIIAFICTMLIVFVMGMIFVRKIVRGLGNGTIH